MKRFFESRAQRAYQQRREQRRELLLSQLVELRDAVQTRPEELLTDAAKVAELLTQTIGFLGTGV